MGTSTVRVDSAIHHEIQKINAETNEGLQTIYDKALKEYLVRRAENKIIEDGRIEEVLYKILKKHESNIHTHLSKMELLISIQLMLISTLEAGLREKDNNYSELINIIDSVKPLAIKFFKDGRE